MQDYDWFIELLMDEGLTLEEAKAKAAATVAVVGATGADAAPAPPAHARQIPGSLVCLPRATPASTGTTR